MAATLNRVLLLRSTICNRSTVPVISHGPTLRVGEQGQQPVRGFPTNKHYDYKWRALREAKVLKLDLPKFIELKKDKEPEAETPDELRLKMKQQGQLRPRTFQELPINISCTRQIIDEFKPPEGDGKQSLVSTKGVKERFTKGTKNFRSVRKLKKFEDFNESEFAEEAQGIVIETQRLLQDVYGNQARLHELVTEKAFPEMVHGLETKTMRWSFVETVEPPVVKQVRVEEVLQEENLFAQVTVRMHTKQILAIYDQFGRLMFGDPSLAKSVVEYIVMEKWISDTYGRWRIHGKITPDWVAPRGTLIKTWRVPKFDPLPPAPQKEEVKKEEASQSGGDGDVDSDDKPRLATA